MVLTLSGSTTARTVHVGKTGRKLMAELVCMSIWALIVILILVLEQRDVRRLEERIADLEQQEKTNG